MLEGSEEESSLDFSTVGDVSLEEASEESSWVSAEDSSTEAEFRSVEGKWCCAHYTSKTPNTSGHLLAHLTPSQGMYGPKKGYVV